MGEEIVVAAGEWRGAIFFLNQRGENVFRLDGSRGGHFFSEREKRKSRREEGDGDCRGVLT